jgi:hypothetical protein
MTDEQTFAERGIYHIRVRGALDEKRADRLPGFVTTSRDNGETLLTGPVADGAALHRALATIRDLGLPLLFLTQTDCPCRKKNCPRRGQCQECAAYHGAKDKLPYCFREKTKWDRRCAAFTGAR